MTPNWNSQDTSASSGHVDPYHRPDISRAYPAGIPDSMPAISLPSSSVRQMRRTICLAVLAFTVGALAVALNSPFGSGFLAPGPLTNSHAQILGGLNGDRCKACHESAGQPVAAWLAGMLTGIRNKEESLCQSDLCLKCHQASLGSEHPVNPHNLSSGELAALTQKSLAKTAFGNTTQVSSIQSIDQSGIACSVCHREHHGQQFNMAAMTDAQCQSCHTSTFHRFDLDHPAFAVASNSGHALLNFDHASHGTRHFANSNRIFDCKSCHPPDSSGRFRTVAGFEQSCASCHNAALTDSQRHGLELLSVPVLDVDAIRSAGINQPQWPANASGDFDGPLPPLQRLLLAADPALRSLIHELPASFQFSSINPQRPEDLRLAAGLASGYERLFQEISESGKQAIVSRLERVAPSGASEPATIGEKLLAELDDAQLRHTVRMWMPWISKPAINDVPDQSLESGRSLDENRNSPVMRRKIQDGEQLAENPVGQLLQGKALSSKSPRPEIPQSQASQSQLASTGSALQQEWPEQQSSLHPQRSDSIQQATDNRTAANRSGELLATNPLQTGGARSPGIAQPATATSQLSSVTELSGNLAESRSLGNASPKQIVNRSDQLPADGSFFSPAGLNIQSPASGWKTNHDLMVISWHPAGHADPFSRMLLEWISSNSVHPSDPSFNHFAHSFAAPSGPGQCIHCHRTSSLPGNGGPVNWQSTTGLNPGKGFTRFDHGPHNLIADCESCHQLADPNRQTPGRSPFRLAGSQSGNKLATLTSADCGLKPVAANNCTSCHRPNGSPHGCTTCHNYHISGTHSGSVSNRQGELSVELKTN